MYFHQIIRWYGTKLMYYQLIPPKYDLLQNLFDKML